MFKQMICSALAFSTALLACGCWGNSTREDGSSYSGTYYYVYNFSLTGGELASNHANQATFSYASGQGKRVTVNDFYVYYCDSFAYPVGGTGSWNGQMQNGGTVTTSGLYFKVGSHSVYADGEVYIQSLDLCRDGSYNGTATYNFST